MKNNKKIIILSSIIIGILVMVIGVSFSIFNFSKTSTNSQLVLGDIYMHYNESNQLTLENAMPSNTYDSTKYFEFSVSGKNTTTDKDIWYEIVLTHGDNHATRTTRIRDNLLKFTLVEIKDGVETVVVDNKSYSDLTNKRIWVDTINKNTISETTHTYRLYMWISNDTVIGNVYQDYTMEEWNDVFASIKVNVTGDFTEKELPLTSSQTIERVIAEKAISNPTCQTTVEEDGITYISGSQECIDFNYVWYSGKLWRITQINPDGTMKLITDDIITTISYGSDVNFYTDNENKSYIYQWLNEDFLDTLYNYENIIVTNSKWNSLTTSTIETKITEGANGLTTTIAPVGLLNSYEYYESYQNASSSNGYLHIGYCWWLLNYGYYGRINYYVSEDGGVFTTAYAYPYNTSFGVRPSINLKSNIELKRGSGTITDPYTIVGDKEEVTPNATLLNTRTSGEYVKFNNELYRIVSIENNITKLNKNDYVRDTNNLVLTKKFSASETVTYGGGTSDEYWDYYLNNIWYNSLSTVYKNMMLQHKYYIGEAALYDYDWFNYKASICATASNTVTTKDCEKTTSIWTGLVGLPRYGEMFASQQGSGYSSSSNIYLITPDNNTSCFVIGLYGVSGLTNSDYTNGARPSINLKSTIKITGGNGTKENPFEISM